MIAPGSRRLRRHPMVIAHRGASGYLPEHTLAAKVLALTMRADYIEQDVVLTRDNHPIVFHDLCLDAMTDVATVFPGRAGKDGRYWVIDFSLDEIRQLRVTERREHDSGSARWPGRFPHSSSGFAIPTLGEEIELIQGFNPDGAGICPEIKHPGFHRQAGRDISRIVLQTLYRYGYREQDDDCIVQCFDGDELMRLRRELSCRLRLLQLIGRLDWPLPRNSGAAGRRRLLGIATYAECLGVWHPHLLESSPTTAELARTEIWEHARAAGLEIYPFTLRADELPDGVNDLDELLGLLVSQSDGFFTDFPDICVRYLEQTQSDRAAQPHADQPSG